MLFPLPLIPFYSQPRISLLVAWSINAHCFLLPTNWHDLHAQVSLIHGLSETISAGGISVRKELYTATCFRIQSGYRAKEE